MRPRFACDFDGTIVEDDKYPAIGEWIPGAAEALHALTRVGEVVIFSCRTAPAHHLTGAPRGRHEVQQEVNRIRAKLDEKGFGSLRIWTEPYKPPAAAYIDNKGIAFRGDWTQTLEDIFELIAPITMLQKVYGTDLEPRERDGICCGDCDRCPPFEDDEEPFFPFLMADYHKAPERHPSSQRFVERVQGWIGLHDQKQKDYGTDADPFANVRESARALGLPPWIGTVIRMNDKMRRLNTAAKQWIETGEVNLANEGVLDSFDDLGVYSGIGAVCFEEES